MAQMVIIIITIKMSLTLEFSFKKLNKAITNTIFKMKADLDKNLIQVILIRSHTPMNIITEIMEVNKIINFKEM